METSCDGRWKCESLTNAILGLPLNGSRNRPNLLVFNADLGDPIRLAYPRTRPISRGFAALALGLAEVAVLLSANGLTFGEGKLLGVTFALSAAVLFALGAVLNRHVLPIQRTLCVIRPSGREAVFCKQRCHAARNWETWRITSGLLHLNGRLSTGTVFN